VRRALGKGLSQLMTSSAFQAETDSDHSTTLDISVIVANKNQPRTRFDEQQVSELADSIKAVGLLQPLVVRPLPAGKYEIVVGERRFRAAKLAGLKEVPVIVRAVSDHKSLQMALIENIQREDLTPVESAYAYQRLMTEFELTQEQLAAEIGKSRPAIANTLRLLRLPERILESLSEGEVTEGQVRPLLTLKSEADQLAVFELILKNNLSARQVEEIVNARTEPKEPKKKVNVAKEDPNWIALAERVSQKLGAMTTLTGSEKGGSIKIAFSSEEDLIRIMDALGVTL
jgi:ParB family chromosome partitioning protein